ncbi:MAG: phosphate butyryltransferase [Bacteroidales bacterium]|jgi:phosphate butyryltransferase|nr:phosphate butyryltransferase [Bacteroidales bacterium]
MDIIKLEQLISVVKSRPRKRLVAAFANDDHTISAVHAAVQMGMIEATLVGDATLIHSTCKNLGIDSTLFHIVHEPVDTAAALLSCDFIHRGEGDILMKGSLSTDKYMRAILNKEKGLCPPNALLTHVAVLELPSYHKLLFISDCAIIPQPDFKQKLYIMNLLIRTARSLGIVQPKVAILSATEQISPAMQSTVEAAALAQMVQHGQIAHALADGPLSLDLAIDRETASLKKYESQVAGDADCLLFPNIESGNIFYKACTKFGDAHVGAFLAGAKVPCVLSSRGDSVQTKLYSIAMSAISQ